MSLTLFSPAKVNLYLHIIDRLDTGYHNLDSLMVFSPDIGDEIIITPADSLTMEVAGPYKDLLIDTLNTENNLMIKAAEGFAKLAGKDAAINIRLVKNLPIAAGIGGGSSNAATLVKGLMQLWSRTPDDIDGLDAFLLSLGADVPVCFYARASHVTGIGDTIKPTAKMPKIYSVLINPNQPCPTGPIFKGLDLNALSGIAQLTDDDLSSSDALIKFLKRSHNDLTKPAIQTLPIIQDVLNALHNQTGCEICRMSGSGATCFGIFTSQIEASSAAAQLQQANPDWWVASGRLQ